MNIENQKHYWQNQLKYESWQKSKSEIIGIWEGQAVDSSPITLKMDERFVGKECSGEEFLQRFCKDFYKNMFLCVPQPIITCFPFLWELPWIFASLLARISARMDCEILVEILALNVWPLFISGYAITAVMHFFFVGRQLCWKDHSDFSFHGVCTDVCRPVDGCMYRCRFLVNIKGKPSLL